MATHGVAKRHQLVPLLLVVHDLKPAFCEGMGGGEGRGAGWGLGMGQHQ